MTTILCDLDGVVYLGEQEIAGSGDALVRLDKAGMKVMFITNNATRSQIEAAEKIERVTGFAAKAGSVITSAMAAASLVGPTGAPTLLVGAAGAVPDMTRFGCPLVTSAAEAKAVIVGLDTNLSYTILTEATRALVGGARFVATNLDPTYPLPGGPAPGAGALVSLLETSSGRRAEAAGKPHEPIRALIRESIVDGPVYVVGDRVSTDLAMGAAEGWTTVLVQTGIDRAGAADLTLRSLAHFADQLLTDQLTDAD